MNFIFVQTLVTLLLDSANGRPVTPNKEITDKYDRDNDMQKLKLHLQLRADAM